MDLGAVMDELGVALTTIPGLRVFPYWSERPTPPFAIVGFPEVDFDLTLGNGGERLSIPVTVGVGMSDQRSARNRIIGYAKGTGFGTVKNAIETHVPMAWSSARVSGVEFSVGSWGGIGRIASVEYLTATFTVDIIGSGA